MGLLVPNIKGVKQLFTKTKMIMSIQCENPLTAAKFNVNKVFMHSIVKVSIIHHLMLVLICNYVSGIIP